MPSSGRAGAPAALLVVDPADRDRAGPAAEILPGELLGAPDQVARRGLAAVLLGAQPLDHGRDPAALLGPGERRGDEDDDPARRRDRPLTVRRRRPLRRTSTSGSIAGPAESGTAGIGPSRGSDGRHGQARSPARSTRPAAGRLARATTPRPDTGPLWRGISLHRRWMTFVQVSSLSRGPTPVCARAVHSLSTACPRRPRRVVPSTTHRPVHRPARANAPDLVDARSAGPPSVHRHEASGASGPPALGKVWAGNGSPRWPRPDSCRVR